MGGFRVSTASYSRASRHRRIVTERAVKHIGHRDFFSTFGFSHTNRRQGSKGSTNPPILVYNYSTRVGIALPPPRTYTPKTFTAATP